VYTTTVLYPDKERDLVDLRSVGHESLCFFYALQARKTKCSRPRLGYDPSATLRGRLRSLRLSTRLRILPKQSRPMLSI